MPIQKEDGSVEQRKGKGTPQGGVISPLLANLYLHFTLDMWLAKHYPKTAFVRYADDVIIHCISKAEAEVILKAVEKRLGETKLQIKEEKTHIAYCRDYKRREKHEINKFDFLGYSFQPRTRRRRGKDGLFIAFTAEISRSNMKRITGIIRELNVWRNTKLEVHDIASALIAKLRGWINYFGKYGINNLRYTLWSIDKRLIDWLCKKYKIGLRKSIEKLKSIKRAHPALFLHWELRYGRFYE